MNSDTPETLPEMPDSERGQLTDTFSAATMEDVVSPQKPIPPEPSPDEPPKQQPTQDLEDFFQHMPPNLRWPKPDAAAVAAAVEAIQRLSANPEPMESADPLPAEASSGPATCGGCGEPLGERTRFCGNCGLAIPGASASDLALSAGVSSPSPATPGQHHYHHHYHHFISGSAGAAMPASEPVTAAARPAGAVGKTAPGGRAEAAARQLVQDWAQACNTKHLDDLVELYSPDATVIRSNVPPVRSVPAIREFLVSLLEAGLGDVEMESLRTDVLGDVALEIGRCKMLVPVAMGKRREERGKYLLVLARQPGGSWKILADSWSSDLGVGSVGEASATRSAGESPPSRKR